MAIVEVDGEQTRPRYIYKPFKKEPDFTVTSVNYDLKKLMKMAQEPN